MYELAKVKAVFEKWATFQEGEVARKQDAAQDAEAIAEHRHDARACRIAVACIEFAQAALARRAALAGDVDPIVRLTDAIAALDALLAEGGKR